MGRWTADRDDPRGFNYAAARENSPGNFGGRFLSSRDCVSSESYYLEQKGCIKLQFEKKGILSSNLGKNGYITKITFLENHFLNKLSEVVLLVDN